MFKVYLGNLDPRTTVETLKPYFAPFGEAVDEIIVALDEEGKPRGFAIVLFRDPQLGQLAIETLTGKRINGREVQINEAVKKGKRTREAGAAPRVVLESTHERTLEYVPLATLRRFAIPG